MDKATEEYVGLMADTIATSRVLMILTYRPGYVQPFGDRTYHTRLALTALADEASVRMAQAMLATEHLPGELEALIIRKAEGNPFFVEEVVKSLQEVGALRPAGDRYVLARSLDEIVVPDTIQDVIMARVDRLDEAAKKTLQLASVIGREFTRRLLDRIADIPDRTEGTLRELKAIELIYEKALFPELAYMFKHALTHDVVYHSLLVQRRKELHRLIGLAIEELYAARLGEHYEMLAHHFSRAEDWTKALNYLLKAADKSAKTFANREAISFYDQALEVARHRGDAVSGAALMDIRKTKVGLCMLLSDFQSAHAEGERLHALAREAMDRPAEAAALAGMGVASFFAHQFEQAHAESHQAIGIARPLGATRVLATGYHTVGSVQAVRDGHLEQAGDWLKRALDFARSTEDAAIICRSLSMLAIIENWRGGFAEAASLEAEALRIGREHNLLFMVIQGLWGRGLFLIGKGDYDEALAALEEGLTLCQKVGADFYRDRILNTLGWLWMECGNLDRATDLNRRGAESARKRGDPETIANAEINLGDVFLARDDLPLALDVLEGVHGLVRNTATSDWMKWRYSAHLFASLGELWLARGDATKAREFSQQCLELATRSNSRKYLVRGWRLQGEIALARRQWDEANTALRTALDSAEAIGNPPQLWKTHLAMGRFHGELGRVEAARQAHRAARDVIERLKANLRDADLRASVESAPMIRLAYKLAEPE
jgi:tetratricopeptide (TPR) repeat protein